MKRSTRKKVNETIANENSRVSIHDVEDLSDDVVVAELLYIIDNKDKALMEQEQQIEVIGKLKVVLTTTNSDEVSGTSILSDGTKAFWSEGRSSHVVVIGPDQRVYHVDAVHDINGVYALMSGDAIGAAPMRAATEMEEAEHAVARRFM